MAETKNILFLTLLLLFKIGFSQVVMNKLPDTGQEIKYTTTFGEDADYVINPPSFTDNGDGTIKDNVTGLTWQKGDGGEMTWEMATDYCENLSLANIEWRLPDPYESFGILDHSLLNPAVDQNYFTKTKAEYWWSNTERVDDATKAWATNAGGGIGPHPKSETVSNGGIKKFHTRCVKDETWTSELTNNKDGTISDSKTGLIWVTDDNSEKLTWEKALVYAENLSFAGYDDWRLPNVKELQSIVDVAFVNPSVNSSFFTNTLQLPYWTSTTLINDTARAWMTDFKFGIVSYMDKNEVLNVRCVRGEKSTASNLESNTYNQSQFNVSIENNKTLVFHIKNSAENKLSFKLCDTSGNLIEAFLFEECRSNDTLRKNIEGINPGIYIICLISGEKAYSKKILIK